jgi:transcriptional regulator with XRE-family HTH domain
MNTNPVLSGKIKHYRKVFGMTQEEFASELGVEALHISNIERGKKGISLEMLLLICKRFNVSMSDLMPVTHEGAELKAKWIAEILETLEVLEPSQVGIVKTMVCALRG